MVAHASQTRVWTAPLAQEHKASPGAGQLPTEARRRACPCRPLSEGYGHHNADHRAPWLAGRRPNIRTMGSR